MSLRRAARSLVCVAAISSTVPAVLRAEESTSAEHAPVMVTKVYAIGDLAVPLASKAAPDFESLIDLIELRTGADCWKHGGGPGSVTAIEDKMCLVVRQSQAVHERIANLLDEVRGTSDLALCVEMQVIRGDLDACGEGKSHRSAQGLVDATGRQRLLSMIQGQSDSQVIAAPKVTFFNGRSASIEIAGEESPMALEIHGVVSKDNRYARLWLDGKVGGQAETAELLVPEGHTAVRKLPGEDNWLMVTTRVINAEEPQVITPLKNPLPHSAEQKRYLVPSEDLPDPTELTVVPEFKAQAEGFGVSVAVQHPREEEGRTDRVTTVGADDKPALAKGVEQVEYQVAQAEPRTVTDVAVEGPGRVSVELEEVRSSEDPPAQLDVCLDDRECQSARKSALKAGRVFEHVFVAPTAEFPLRHDVLIRTQNGQRIATLNLTNPDSWRQAIRMKKESHELGTLIIEPAKQGIPQFPVDTVSARESSRCSKVQQASGEASAESVETHVKTAAVELEELGLHAEARVLRGLLHSLEIRAQERCQQIDQEIGRLKAARAKLEELSQRSASAEGPASR